MDAAMKHVVRLLLKWVGRFTSNANRKGSEMVDCQSPVKYLLYPWGKKDHDAFVYDTYQEMIGAIRKEYMNCVMDDSLVIEEVIYRRTLKVTEVTPPVFSLDEVFQ